MSIRELITPETVTLDLKAGTPEEAMAELGALLVKTGAVTDLETYLQAVKAREALGTTAVGFGVAIPHGKSGGVSRAAVAFGRSRSGLAWESLDGEPVQMVFLIAAPDGAHDLHLKALSQLARLLMHEEVRQKLLTAESPADVVNALQ
ncbi:fructose-specific phosphotransferase system IIA component [Symbiobacterium terraclitae]|uniref:Fructose-specific phosphotransferase system IIA component n=1 Tax=Symbiobacterium terraclitae TaxID=557451 RepID=A0ABS4JQJ9_9FIRM|nr:fructose-specific phosphotransferase system IIA component [Symbiobacterium terraclitae]